MVDTSQIQKIIKEGRQLMQGNEAIAKGAIVAGCRFFAGYPITPASEIAEHMARLLPKVGGIFIQAEDELAAISMIIGASWGGKKAMTATSGPGFSLMQEGIGYACVTETPCVIVNMQRGGPSTGQPTFPAQGDVYQARYGSHGDYALIVLAPSTVQEAFQLTIDAFNYSEKYRVPVILLGDEIIAHTRETVDVPPLEGIEIFNRKKPKEPPEAYVPFRADEDDVPPMANFGEGYHLLVDGQLHDERGVRAGSDPEISARLVKRLWEKIENKVDEITKYESYYMDDAEIAVITYGTPSRSALRAVKDARKEGIKVGLVKLLTIWPFPDKLIREISEQVSRIIVPEMNMGKIHREIKRASCADIQIDLISKVGGVLHTPQEIYKEIVKG